MIFGFFLLLSVDAHCGGDGPHNLYKLMFYNDSRDLALDDVTPELHHRIEAFREKRQSFKSKIITKHRSADNPMGHSSLVNLEGAMVSLIDAPNIKSIAAQYLQEAKLSMNGKGSAMGR